MPWEELVSGSDVLPRRFYERPAEEVAQALIGKLLVRGKTAGRIVEVEAYQGLKDRAAHAWHGLTPRTKVLFGPPGHAYVYFIYGMYYCLNVVAEPEGSPGCVLIRALEPLAGLELMRRRRPGVSTVTGLASGPGKLTLAMGIGRQENGADLTLGSFTIRRSSPEPALQILTTPRIGIRHETGRLLRFAVAGSRFASR